MLIVLDLTGDERYLARVACVQGAGLSRRMDLDLEMVMARLRQQGVRFAGKQDSLERIARLDGITPMAVYEVIRPLEKTPDAPSAWSAEQVEASCAGSSGLGRKTLAQKCAQIKVDMASALQRLAEKGIEAEPEDSLRELAERQGMMSPIDLLTIVLLPGEQAAQ